MSEQTNHPKYLEPGTIDATRKNIGAIDPEEAAKMTKILGGEIMTERPFDPSSTPLSHTSRAREARVQKAHNQKEKKDKSSSSKDAHTNGSSKQKSKHTGSAPISNGGHIQDLPVLSKKEFARMQKLMKDSEYGIRNDYGIFNFMSGVFEGHKEKVASDFVKFVLKNHIDHIKAFSLACHNFIEALHDSLKKKVQDSTEMKYKFLRTVASWDISQLEFLHSQLLDSKDMATIQMLIPFEKELYQIVLSVFFLGEQRVNKMLQEVLNEAVSMPNAQKTHLNTLILEISSQWFYLCQKIVKLNYPLLMRMCSLTFEDYPDFFQTKFQNIISFLGISKFDLLMQQKTSQKDASAQKQEKAEEEEKAKTTKDEIGKDELVTAGLALLERLFPQAGFSHLEDLPDLFPYFYPIYEFEDGYNMLAPNNPMQVTVVLLEIIEEFFQGCRNIKFDITSDDPLATEKDNIQKVLSEWSLYREVVFEKNYNDELKNYVNQLYSQPEYDKSQYGKKTLSNILWATKYYFFPYFKFERLVLDQPVNDTKYRPLYLRTAYVKKLFSELSCRAQNVAKQRGAMIGIGNPWEKYSFDIPNSISKRLDVLLGAKKNNPAACNANLLRYALCVVSVLDWWVNAPCSPAYSDIADGIYRISKEDGKPVFSVPLVKTQNQLFIQSVKQNFQANAQMQNQ